LQGFQLFLSPPSLMPTVCTLLLCRFGKDSFDAVVWVPPFHISEGVWKEKRCIPSFAASVRFRLAMLLLKLRRRLKYYTFHPPPPTPFPFYLSRISPSLLRHLSLVKIKSFSFFILLTRISGLPAIVRARLTNPFLRVPKFLNV